MSGNHNDDLVDNGAPAWAVATPGLGALGPHATSKDEVYSTLSRIGVGAGLSFLARRTITRRRQSKKSQTKKQRRRDDDSPSAAYQMLLPAPAPAQQSVWPGAHATQPAATTRSHGLAAPIEARVQRSRAPVERDPLVPSASRWHSFTTTTRSPPSFPASPNSSTARGDHQQPSMDALLRLFLPSDDDDDANDDGARQLVTSDWSRQEQFEAAAAAASPRLLTVAQDLHLYAITMSHLQAYRSNLWPIVPLNPACLLEDSIKMVLSSEGEGATPLSLSVHIGLSLGAILAGHTQLAVEFRMKAREELSYIFDQPEYAIAQALVAMAYLDVRLGREELGEAGGQHLYFLKLATTLCRQIGAQNSDVYLRSLIILAQVDTNSEEATAELHREYAQMERYPYDPLFSLNRHSRDIIPISATALSRITYSCRIILQAVLGVKLARQQLDRAEREGRMDGVGRLHDTFHGLLDLMDRMETQFHQYYRESGGKSNPEFSDSVYVSLRLYLYRLRAECWRSLSQPQMALGWAKEFLRIGSLPASIYASNGSLSIFSVVDVFRDMHEVDSMRQLLQILDRWVVAFPALRSAKRRCAAVLGSPDFSSSSSAPPPFPTPQAARLPSSSSPSSSSSSLPSSGPDPRIT